MGALFSADGIRGVVDLPPLDSTSLNIIGAAISNYLVRKARPGKKISLLIGSDTRNVSKQIKLNLIGSFLKNASVKVEDVGILPTAAISYLLAKTRSFSGGIIVTGSHAPLSIESGIKIFNEDGEKIDETAEGEIQKLYDQFSANPSSIRNAQRSSSLRTDPNKVFRQEYAEALIDEFKGTDWRSFHIVLDCANGAASYVVPYVFNKLGINCIYTNYRPNGKNMNVECGSENLRFYPWSFDMLLKQKNLSLAIALDGDADRVVMVCNNHRFFDGDMLLAVLAKRLKSGDKVVITSMSNQGLTEYLSSKKIGLSTKVVSNGDKYITDALIDENLVLGGEQIGHIIFRDEKERITGDGIRTALLILAELAKSESSNLIDMIPGMVKWQQINVTIPLKRRTNVQKNGIPGLLEKINQIESSPFGIFVRACRPASTEASYRIVLESKNASVNILSGTAHEMASIIQHRFGCEGDEIFILDLTNGGLIV